MYCILVQTAPHTNNSPVYVRWMCSCMCISCSLPCWPILSLPIQKVSAANKWCGLKPARNAYARSKWLTVKTRMCYRTEPHSKLSHIHSYSIHARQIWEGSRSTKIIRISQFWRLYGSKLCDFIAYMNKNLWKEQDAEKNGSRTLGGVQAKFVGSTLRACTSPSTISGSLKFSRIRKAQADHDIKFMHWYNIEFALEDRMH